ncbi:uridine diphosphate glucose pyrophosphatase NUDT22-like [Mytilus californianus]|uniref:uridine diphosphate glucose pyrophosphatase NUDT22-like n=1 Tax=Mytilus californianus TaxID=6549 RepID=UPI0022451C90|nr:uridine diphosphate glucose pyrophosphatase NUDT22-like [Mytilus californianus]
MDSEVEMMFCTPPSITLNRNSTVVRNSSKFNRNILPELETDIDDIWSDRLKKNPKLYNATKFRLDTTELNANKVKLNIGITSYKDFIGTNWSPNAKELQNKGETIFNNPQGFMSDALGVGALLLSSDNYVTFQMRSLDCGEACGMWDIPGGHAEPKEIVGKKPMSEIEIDDIDPEKITNEIYDSILREVVDEVNIPMNCLSDPLLMGICRNNTSAGRPSAEFLIRCSLKSNEIRELYLQGNQAEADESTCIRLLPLDEVLNMTEEHEMWKNMAPSSKGCITLAKKFKF